MPHYIHPHCLKPIFLLQSTINYTIINHSTLFLIQTIAFAILYAITLPLGIQLPFRILLNQS